MSASVQAGHRLRFRPGTSFTLLVHKVCKRSSSSGCGKGGKRLLFSTVSTVRPSKVLFSSMPTCRRTNVFGFFIEYTE